MQFGATHKLGRGGMLILAAMSLLALFAAFIVVPGLAKGSGLSETAVTYIVAGLALLIAVGSTFAAKALNKRNLPER
jgi:hypothetical protein